MKAIVYAKPGELQLHERAMPQRSPDEALLRIRRVGVCGTPN